MAQRSAVDTEAYPSSGLVTLPGETSLRSVFDPFTRNPYIEQGSDPIYITQGDVPAGFDELLRSGALSGNVEDRRREVRTPAIAAEEARGVAAQRMDEATRRTSSKPERFSSNTEMSDAEVFGNGPLPSKAAQSQTSIMTDDEVFGKPAVAPKAVGPMSDDMVGLSNLGIIDYLGEVGKNVVKGAVEGSVASPLRGLGAQNLGPDQTMESAISRIQGGQDLNEAISG